jgi:hypothetical protein
MKNKKILSFHAIYLPWRGKLAGGIRFSIINGWPHGGHGGGFSL